MDGANKRFMNRKVGWLADHLIVYGVNKTGGSDNPFGQQTSTINSELPVHQFDLRKIGDIINGNNAAKAYELRKIDELKGVAPHNVARTIGRYTHPIHAYFLPWGRNTTYCGKLGVNADYFFTPTLNGCSFTHAGGGVSPSVAHANFVDPATTLTDQNAIDADLRQKFGAVPNSILIKTDYKQAAVGLEDYKATVIGIRNGNSWSFYYQNYKVELQHGQLVTSGVNLCVPI